MVVATSYPFCCNISKCSVNFIPTIKLIISSAPKHAYQSQSKGWVYHKKTWLSVQGAQTEFFSVPNNYVVPVKVILKVTKANHIPLKNRSLKWQNINKTAKTSFYGSFLDLLA